MDNHIFAISVICVFHPCSARKKHPSLVVTLFFSHVLIPSSFWTILLDHSNQSRTRRMTITTLYTLALDMREMSSSLRLDLAPRCLFSIMRRHCEKKPATSSTICMSNRRGIESFLGGLRPSIFTIFEKKKSQRRVRLARLFELLRLLRGYGRPSCCCWCRVVGKVAVVPIVLSVAAQRYAHTRKVK